MWDDDDDKPLFGFREVHNGKHYKDRVALQPPDDGVPLTLERAQLMFSGPGGFNAAGFTVDAEEWHLPEITVARIIEAQTLIKENTNG